MTYKIIDGKKMAFEIIENLKEDIKELKTKNIEPHLSIIFIGNDHASETYVRMKKKTSDDIGIKTNIHRMGSGVKEEEITSLIERLNNDEKTHGIMVQLPLPNHLNTKKILEKISPAKDVDGLTSQSIAKIILKDERFAPATPKAIIHI